MKRALLIIGLLSFVVAVTAGQCPHAFFKAHTVRGPVTCESRGCTYSSRMQSLWSCALDEARYELSVRFPGRDAEWAAVQGPDRVKFIDGVFLTSIGPVFGLTDSMDDGTYETTVGLIGDFPEDFDTCVHEIQHTMADRVLSSKQNGAYQKEIDNGLHTTWFRDRSASK